MYTGRETPPQAVDSSPDPNVGFARKIPQLSSISSVEKPGPKFMETIFQDLKPGEIGVAPNADRTIYYVVKVKERAPADPEADADFKEKVLQAEIFTPPAPAQLLQFFATPYYYLSQEQERTLVQEWFDRLENKYDLQINLPNDQRASR